jgi:HipA-like kinase
MSTTETLYAVEHIHRMRGGSQAHLIRASDNNWYVTKFQNNPQHIRVLANEYFGSKLGVSMGLPMPEVKIIDVSEQLIANTPELCIETSSNSAPCATGLQCASLFVANPEQDYVFDFLPEAMFQRIANRQAFTQVLAFDKWVGNCDGRQAVFTKTPGQNSYHLTFIDQGYCFNGDKWNFPDLPLMGVYYRNHVYQSVAGLDSFEPLLSYIEEVDLASLCNIAHEIPAIWYENNTEAMCCLLKTLHKRRSLVRQLITAFRDSSRIPFPNWANH